MADRFRKRVYLKTIVKERNRIINPSIYIYPEAEYLLTWSEFFRLSELPNEHRQLFQEKYQHYYIYSNCSLIDSHRGNEIDTFKWLKFSYTQMSFLKNKFPCSYQKLLYNLQLNYLERAYSRYHEVPIKLRKKFEDFLFTKIDLSVEYYDDFYSKKLE
ncbi:hypothetical protein [Enterococcus sp. AZ103]|uniref:hypothetical protein n=1 Tax=Enterococcus sp. AZ103 TaxID=2774628 RepID=UPI003F28F352